MARLVYGMNLSLDGYADHDGFAPGPGLFRHWIEQVRGVTGSLYGRRLYEIMRYWDDEQPGWSPAEQEFAVVWRSKPKWVISTTLASVGPNATLLGGAVEAAVRGLKDSLDGEIDVGGPVLAHSLSGLGLIDEYRLYYHPVVLGRGKPFFSGPVPPLRFVASEDMGEDVVRLTYVPA
jgi:dihydrofolate reductase